MIRQLPLSKFMFLDHVKTSSSSSISPVSTTTNLDSIKSPNLYPITFEPKVDTSLETSFISQSIDDIPLVNNVPSLHHNPSTITHTPSINSKANRHTFPPPYLSSYDCPTLKNLQFMALLFQVMTPKAIKWLSNTQIRK